MSSPLDALRAVMLAQQIDAYLIPTADPHGSEYVGAHFATRAYVSGFTGSAGSLLVLADWAGLWTDARYHLQAEEELKGSGIVLCKEGLPKTPTLESVLRERLPDGACVAFDGRCVSARRGSALRQMLSPKEFHWKTSVDLVAQIWQNRPPRSKEAVWLWDEAYAGASRQEKLRRVRTHLANRGATWLLITALEEIAWLLNLRGGDIPCTPVALAYCLISQDDVRLCIQEDALSPEVREALSHDSVGLFPYEAIDEQVASLQDNTHVLADGRRVNLHLWELRPAGARFLDVPSPIEGLKAVKNQAELDGMRRAHLKDGLALTKFLYWLAHITKWDDVSELSATAVLEGFRQEQADYLGPSFSPIVAYGAHGAIVHYCATNDSNAALHPSGFLLVDSGGQYLDGTTDCTRTIPLGPLSQEEILHYTTVLRGHLALMAAKFPRGCTGAHLDCLARAPLWALGLDYRHGTGHGVGALLGVHEGPQQIRWQTNSPPLQEGMITSNEPGFYRQGQYGIRLENLLLCVLAETSEYADFLGFESLTAVPFHPQAIQPSCLQQDERDTLNRYHQWVYDSLSPHLTAEEAHWLNSLTRPL